MGLDEFERVRELERQDPLNDQGLLGHFLPNRVKVPRVTVTRLQGKQNTLNKVLMRAELPSKLTKCEILSNDEHNMVFSGRDKASKPDSEKKGKESKPMPPLHTPERGHKLLCQLQYGRCDWNHIMELYSAEVKQKVKTPSFKPVNECTENHISMENYFCIKRPDFAVLKEVNPEVIHTPGLYQA